MANRIRVARKAKGMTLEQLGKLIGKKRNTVSRYENGQIEPKMETWQKLADALDVSVQYLQGHTINLEQQTIDLDELIAEFRKRLHSAALSDDELAKLPLPVLADLTTQRTNVFKELFDPENIELSDDSKTYSWHGIPIKKDDMRVVRDMLSRLYPDPKKKA